MSTNGSGNGGIGLLGALAILFICLKLSGGITWSWLWVTAPLWVPMALVVVAAAVVIAVFVVRDAIRRTKRARQA